MTPREFHDRVRAVERRLESDHIAESYVRSDCRNYKDVLKVAFWMENQDMAESMLECVERTIREYKSFLREPAKNHVFGYAYDLIESEIERMTQECADLFDQSKHEMARKMNDQICHLLRCKRFMEAVAVKGWVDAVDDARCLIGRAAIMEGSKYYADAAKNAIKAIEDLLLSLRVVYRSGMLTNEDIPPAQDLSRPGVTYR